MKVCSRCKEEKPREAFSTYKKSKEGLRWNCRSCEAALSKTWRQANPEKRKATRRRDYLKNKEKQLSQGRVWRESNKDRMRELHYLATYDIDLSTYEALLKNQNSVCAICFSSVDRLHVDHNHNTDEIRGLLCRACNTGLGMFKDNIDTLLQAVAYLKEKSIEL